MALDRADKKKFRHIAAELKRYKDSVQIVAVPRILVSAHENRRIRLDFEREAKNSFFKSIAVTQKSALAALFGFNDDDLSTLEISGLTGHPSARRTMREYSVDHIRPISLGGTNAISNLCLVPAALNGIKAAFEQLQKNAKPKEPSILTVMPLCDGSGAYQQIIPLPA